MIRPLSPHSAALLITKNARILIIADLHIGWELALSKKGIHVPSQTPKLLEKLTNLIFEHKPNQLLILGDVKHTVAGAETGEWQDIPSFFNEIEKLIKKITVIRGNHDGNLEPLLPNEIKLLPSSGTAIGGVGFFHGHRWPSPAILKCRTLVMGHVHPVIVFHDLAGFRTVKQAWVKADCDRTALLRISFKKKRKLTTKAHGGSLVTPDSSRRKRQQLFIMPSFNDFLGGRPLNERRPWNTLRPQMTTGPVLRSEAVDLQNAETYLLDGTYLGSLGQLKA